MLHNDSLMDDLATYFTQVDNHKLSRGMEVPVMDIVVEGRTRRPFRRAAFVSAGLAAVVAVSAALGFVVWNRGQSTASGPMATVIVQICHSGVNAPTCRVTLPAGSSLSAAQQETASILRLRLNTAGISNVTVEPYGSDEVKVTASGSLSRLLPIVGVSDALRFATSVVGVPNVSNPQFGADQEGLYDPTQFSDSSKYPMGDHWKIDDALTGTITSATAVYGTDGWGVDISFNAAGANEWHTITEEAYACYSITTGIAQGASAPTGAQCPPGRTDQGASQIAIFVDSQVLTAPTVTGGGQTGTTRITESTFTGATADQLAAAISGGPLPADISVVSSQSR